MPQASEDDKTGSIPERTMIRQGPEVHASRWSPPPDPVPALPSCDCDCDCNCDCDPAGHAVSCPSAVMLWLDLPVLDHVTESQKGRQ